MERSDVIFKTVPVHKWPFSVPPPAGRQIRILILEILQSIPMVKILIFLDLAKTISFLDGHYIMKTKEGNERRMNMEAKLVVNGVD